MGKRRRGQREVLEKQRGHWDNALECHNERGLVIQVDGLGSSTGTIFARIKKTSSSSSSSLREIVDLAFKANGFLDQIHIDELFRLGAVWILPPKDKVHPQIPLNGNEYMIVITICPIMKSPVILMTNQLH